MVNTSIFLQLTIGAVEACEEIVVPTVAPHETLEDQNDSISKDAESAFLADR
jgi:hypothetical protein